jgi:hypothetical protein
MDRNAAQAYLSGEYRDLATDAKFTTDQTTEAYNTAIDMSLRQLGVEEADLPTADVEQAKTIKYLALLDYYALRRFARLLAIRFDVAVGSGALDAKRSQAFDQVQMLLQDAAQVLSNLGINVGGEAAVVRVGRINLDYVAGKPPTGEFGHVDCF